MMIPHFTLKSLLIIKRNNNPKTHQLNAFSVSQSVMSLKSIDVLELLISDHNLKIYKTSGELQRM